MHAAVSPVKPPRLLVSVRSADEAIAALEGGIAGDDIIDIKDPSRGPLGMAHPRTIESIIAAVNNRVAVSVALGELRDEPDVSKLPPGITYAKVGLRGERVSRWQPRLTALFERIPSVRPVGVVYIDCLGGSDPHRAPEFEHVLRWCIANNAAGILIDTYKKNGAGLFGIGTSKAAYPDGHAMFDRLRAKILAEHVRDAHRAGRFIALAGQLAGASLERAAALRPDIIAVRGAVCVGNDRSARVDAGRVRELKRLLAAHASPAAIHAG